MFLVLSTGEVFGDSVLEEDDGYDSDSTRRSLTVLAGQVLQVGWWSLGLSLPDFHPLQAKKIKDIHVYIFIERERDRESRVLILFVSLPRLRASQFVESFLGKSDKFRTLVLSSLDEFISTLVWYAHITRAQVSCLIPHISPTPLLCPLQSIMGLVKVDFQPLTGLYGYTFV